MKVTTAQLQSAIHAYPAQSAELEEGLSHQLMDMLLSVENEATVYHAAVEGDARIQIVRFLLNWNRGYNSPLVLDRKGLNAVNKFVIDSANCDN